MRQSVRIALVGCWAVIALITAAPPVRAERASADLLARARQRIREGDARGAARVAEQLAQADPENGGAHFVLGLALYHATDYAGALAAFEDARQSAHPPAAGPLAINEGAALFALGRYRDAVRAFERATRLDASLEALAAIYAAQASLGAEKWDDARRYAARAEALSGAAELRGTLPALRAEIASRERAVGAEQALRWQQSARAALDQGHLPTAIAHYQQALAHAGEAQLPVRERADLIYALGHARYRAGRYAAAAADFAAAAALVPADSDVRFMAALTDYGRGRLAAARLGFEQALALGLDDAQRASAEAYAVALATGLGAAGRGWGLYLEAGAGFDSNVIQLGAYGNEVVGAELRASPLAAATAQIDHGQRAGRRLFLRGAYLFQQVAYLERTLDPFSVQLHRIRADAEIEVLPSLRLGAGAGAELHYTGVRNLRGFQRLFFVEPSVAVDIGDHATTVATFTLDAKAPMSEDARPLGGHRWEARLGQRLHGRNLRGELALRHARENVGQRDFDLGQLDTFWRGRYLIPYSYRSNAVLFEGTGRWRALQVGLGGAYEQLRYRADTVLRVVDPQGAAPAVDLERQRRHDNRVTGNLSLAWWLSRRWALTLRYDFTWNQSTLRFAFDDKTFTKHAAGAGLLFRH